MLRHWESVNHISVGWSIAQRAKDQLCYLLCSLLVCYSILILISLYIEEQISFLKSELEKGHLTKEEFDKKVANEKNTIGLRLIPLYLYPSLPIGIILTSIDGKEIAFDGSNIDTDVRFGCLAWGIKPKKD